MNPTPVVKKEHYRLDDTPLSVDIATVIATNEQFAANLRRARESAGVTRDELAITTSLSLSTIRRFEAGLISPRLESVRRLADALDVDVSDLIEVTNP